MGNMQVEHRILEVEFLSQPLCKLGGFILEVPFIRDFHIASVVLLWGRPTWAENMRVEIIVIIKLK